MNEQEKREKVINGLKCIWTWAKSGCLSNDDFEKIMATCDGALELLKAQEPVMVEERADTDTINCPRCGQQFARVGRDKSIYLDTDEEPNYCPKCGQAVKWN